MMDLKERERNRADWLNLIWDRDKWLTLVNMIMKLQVTYNGRNMICS